MPPYRLLHIGVHNSANRNAGDTLLFPVVRRVFDTVLGPCNWELMQAWQPFLPMDSHRVNNEFDGIVIGGGGLLLRDQVGSDVTNSGWQWNSTISALKSLQIPIFVFAIGYNRFRDQDDFDPIFTSHIRALIQKSSFFGLRNTGSIDALTNYLQADQHDALRRQFCPTNVLWQLYPEYRNLAIAHDAKKSRVLAFNAAFDRAQMRYGGNYDEVLMNISFALKVAYERDWKILVVSHKTKDAEIEPYLDRAGFVYESVDLTDAVPEEIMKFYSQIDLAVGMRGHAQMIPFGLRRPILSLISHNKMKYLLDDLGCSDWGIEIQATNLSDRLEAHLELVESSRESLHSKIAQVQQSVWSETLINLNTIASILDGQHT